MIGMDFISFLILLIISVVVSAILHYGLEYYVTPGFWSFCSKVVIGWLGAWIGSPVVGNWPHRFPFLNWGDVWIIPAIIGCAGVLIVAVDLAKMARAPLGAYGWWSIVERLGYRLGGRETLRIMSHSNVAGFVPISSRISGCCTRMR